MTGRPVLPAPVTGADGLPLLGPLREALSGAGPALAPHAVDRAPDPVAVSPLGPGEDAPDDPVAAVVTTTGSTGRAKHVLLPASALLASAGATHDALGGGGTWLLAVPAHTVAGVQVLVRSLVAGTRPEVLDLAGGFDVARFARAATGLAARAPGRRYTSLVPAQLDLLLEAAGHPGTAGGPDDPARALAGFHAVLVGGSALPPAVRARADAAGVRVVSTYGMTETCGGCVYDGVPLPGVEVRTEPLGPAATDGSPGRVVLGGPVVARGYRGATVPGPEGFAVEAGVRWFRTADRGVLDAGRLRLTGRTDDVVVSGGVNVALDAVDRVLRGLPGVRDCLVVAVPSPRWGVVVGALVVADPSARPSGPAEGEVAARARVQAEVRAALGSAAVPRLLRWVERVPLAGVGKPDRVAAVAVLAPEPPPEAVLGDHGGPQPTHPTHPTHPAHPTEDTP